MLFKHLWNLKPHFKKLHAFIHVLLRHLSACSVPWPVLGSCSLPSFGNSWPWSPLWGALCVRHVFDMAMRDEFQQRLKSQGRRRREGLLEFGVFLGGGAKDEIEEVPSQFTKLLSGKRCSVPGGERMRWGPHSSFRFLDLWEIRWTFLVLEKWDVWLEGGWQELKDSFW